MCNALSEMIEALGLEIAAIRDGGRRHLHQRPRRNRFRPGAGGLSARLQYPVNRGAADLEHLCDFRRANPLRLHFAHLGGIYRSRPPLVDAFGLGLGDAPQASSGCRRGGL